MGYALVCVFTGAVIEWALFTEREHLSQAAAQQVANGLADGLAAQLTPFVERGASSLELETKLDELRQNDSRVAALEAVRPDGERMLAGERREGVIAVHRDLWRGAPGEGLPTLGVTVSFDLPPGDLATGRSSTRVALWGALCVGFFFVLSFLRHVRRRLDELMRVLEWIEWFDTGRVHAPDARGDDEIAWFGRRLVSGIQLLAEVPARTTTVPHRTATLVAEPAANDRLPPLTVRQAA